MNITNLNKFIVKSSNEIKTKNLYEILSRNFEFAPLNGPLKFLKYHGIQVATYNNIFITTYLQHHIHKFRFITSYL